jgi:hypothetical protein
MRNETIRQVGNVEYMSAYGVHAPMLLTDADDSVVPLAQGSA